MESEDFDWGDDESVVYKSVPGIAVFVNASGSISIAEQGGMHDDDIIITFPIDRAPAIIEAIKKAAQIA